MQIPEHSKLCKETVPTIDFRTIARKILAPCPALDYSARVTRPSIELSIKIFVILLILSFTFAVSQVMAMIGWL